jgi:phosphoribosylamine---glycine ligase
MFIIGNKEHFMKVLVIGSGGREHAVVKTLLKSKKVTEVICAPGNGGIADDARCVDIGALEIDKMTEFALKEKVGLVCVTPDDPLSAGMVDAMREKGIRAFGPDRKAAEIEGSKVFAKGLMKKYGIPTAKFEVFDDPVKAVEYISKQKPPIVIKADGLALGKGVLVCGTVREAAEGIDELMVKKKFGRSGNRIVIEEYLAGPEVSVLAFCDGNTIRTMPSSQDHKRAFDGDKGLNTGGMGAFSPSPAYTPAVEKYCSENIYRPTVEAMKKENRPYKGVLYFGLILTPDGPKLLEYNARFGDPETQVLLPLLLTDLTDVFDACIDGTLDRTEILWSDEAMVCVVLASGGYPGDYAKGYEISGIEDAENIPGTYLFHAGIKKENGKYYTNGGRVLGAAAKAGDMASARGKAYTLAEKIKYKDMYYRKDIGIK